MIDVIKTKNIKLCAFLKLKGIDPIEVNKVDRGRAEYSYKMDIKDFEKWQIVFNQSEFLAYANNLEAIKDLAY